MLGTIQGQLGVHPLTYLFPPSALEKGRITTTVETSLSFVATAAPKWAFAEGDAVLIVSRSGAKLSSTTSGATLVSGAT